MRCSMVGARCLDKYDILKITVQPNVIETILLLLYLFIYVYTMFAYCAVRKWEPDTQKYFTWIWAKFWPPKKIGFIMNNLPCCVSSLCKSRHESGNRIEWHIIMRRVWRKIHSFDICNLHEQRFFDEMPFDLANQCSMLGQQRKTKFFSDFMRRILLYFSWFRAMLFALFSLLPLLFFLLICIGRFLWWTNRKSSIWCQCTWWLFQHPNALSLAGEPLSHPLSLLFITFRSVSKCFSKEVCRS